MYFLTAACKVLLSLQIYLSLFPLQNFRLVEENLIDIYQSSKSITNDFVVWLLAACFSEKKWTVNLNVPHVLSCHFLGKLAPKDSRMCNYHIMT